VLIVFALGTARLTPAREHSSCLPLLQPGGTQATEYTCGAMKPPNVPSSIAWAGLLLLAVLMRLLAGYASYSGAATPPKFGDYEAQRHWMEITIHYPASQWWVKLMQIEQQQQQAADVVPQRSVCTCSARNIPVSQDTAEGWSHADTGTWTHPTTTSVTGPWTIRPSQACR
jgi:hypothetical protein